MGVFGNGSVADGSTANATTNDDEVFQEGEEGNHEAEREPAVKARGGGDPLPAENEHGGEEEER